MLQFGHGTDAVDEARCQCRLTPRWGGFNSATALTPWMSSTVNSGPAIDGELQFGHGTDAVDDSQYQWQASLEKASIRPRH